MCKTKRSPGGIEIRATVPANGGYLVVLDSFSDDWHATVDGAPAPIARANGLFRSVHLAPGEHTVEFDYRPPSFRIGIAVTAFALCVTVGLFIRRQGPRRHGVLADDRFAA